MVSTNANRAVQHFVNTPVLLKPDYWRVPNASGRISSHECVSDEPVEPYGSGGNWIRDGKGDDE